MGDGTDSEFNLPGAMRSLLNGFGRLTAQIVTVAVERGPEALATMAALRVHSEYHELLESEWAHHPLLDFIRWQTSQAGETLALTLPQDYLTGHATLADLLRAAFDDNTVIDQIDEMVVETGLSSWGAAEFRHGLAHFRSGELDRALAPLTLGLEGLIRETAIDRSLLTPAEADELRSGSRLVKRLWTDDAAYRPYMEKWVFGLANVYRHGGDRGGSESQALHAVCGSAIWANHVLQQPSILDAVHARLASVTMSRYANGQLQIQPDAERLARASSRQGRKE